MDLRKLKALIELVQSSGISELEITEGEERVRINRTGIPFGAGNVPQSAPQQQLMMTQPMSLSCSTLVYRENGSCSTVVPRPTS